MKVILPKTKSSPLKIGRDPKGWPGISTTQFSGEYLSFREGSLDEKTTSTFWILVSQTRRWATKKNTRYFPLYYWLVNDG